MATRAACVVCPMIHLARRDKRGRSDPLVRRPRRGNIGGMTDVSDRLAALRADLKSRGLDAFVTPLTDEHMSEYVGDYARRLAWLTGFQGSAGSAVVTQDRAGIFTDSRYTVQVRQQVPGDLYSYEDVPKSTAAKWLAANAREGDKVGYDAWLHTRSWVADTKALLAENGAELVAVDGNPVDAVWSNQPAPSGESLYVHDDAQAGRSSADKRAEIAAWLTSKKADAVVIAALESVAWLFNIRGADIPNTPLALAYAVVNADGSARLFVDPAKLTPDVEAHLGSDVSVEPRASFEAALGGFAGKTVAADPESCVAGIFAALDAGGAKVKALRDPALLPRAVKNQTELDGARQAHIRDGAALSRFLKWFDETAPKGELDELSAAAQLENFRRESNLLVGLSFDTISGAGPNGALPHYKVTEDTNRPIKSDEIYLVDSGGQYRDGTTDVTRTMIVGTPTDEMKDRFTRVLKGHISLATAIFPAGTTGGQLDAFARQHLWQAGLDYGHGTGHGVGSFLSVHEGPQRIAAASYPGSGACEPLQAGMILSNEPGYYKEGDFGIRIENLVIVEPREVEGAEGEFLGFETITFAPIDLDLVEPSLLPDTEKAWLNDYHAEVREKIAPQIADPAERDWLVESTRAI